MIVSMLQTQSQEDGSVAYAPIFKFTAGDGRSYTVSSGVSSNPPAFYQGQRVQVRYEKDHPDGARIASFWQLWLFPVVFGILSVTASVAAYALYR